MRRIISCAPLTACLLFTLVLSARAQVPPPISLVDTSTAAFVGLTEFGPLDTPIRVTSYGQFLSTFGGSTAGLTNPYLAPSVAAYFANGGGALYVVRVATEDDAALIGVDGGPGARSGVQTLVGLDEVSVVAIPGVSSQTVQMALIAHCEALGDRMALLDPAVSADVSGVLAQRAGLASVAGHGALYFPWVQAAPAGVSLLLPPSGFVAGIFAQTPPADSPVDLIATATAVNVTVTTAQQELLNPAGINAIRFFAGQGVRVWGARTLAQDPEWVYVAVRRAQLVLEESIAQGTAWALLEVNDPSLWNQLRAAVEGFLLQRFVDGWFPGVQPEEAFFVRCDMSTMTQLDVEEGRTVILVGFAPLQPAEFSVFTVVLDRSTVTAAPPSRARRAVLHAPAPNPFNPRTSIRFSLPEAMAVQLGVYDLAGRLVAHLLRGDAFAAGEHQITWDATDMRGTRVGSGVYLLRLQAGGTERTVRAVLIE